MEHPEITPPLISIVIPLHNADSTIETSVKSILAQKYQKWELIIVENGSTDTSYEIALSFTDKRISVISTETTGVSNARNAGILCSKGDFICFLDADDIYYPDTISHRIQFLEKNPNCKAIYGTTVITDENFEPLGPSLGGIDKVEFQHFFGNPIHLNSLMIKGDILKNNLFDTNFKNGEDWLLLQNLARQGVVYHHAPKSKTTYSFRKNSLVTSNFYFHEQSLLQVIDIIYSKDPNCDNPLKEYRNGLKTPSKDIVLLKRQLSLFSFLILAKEYSNANRVADFIISNNLLKPISKKVVLDSINYAFLRFFIIKINKIPELWKTYSESFLFHAKKHFNDPDFQSVIDEIGQRSAS